MKKYFVFGYSTFYPTGGMFDCEFVTNDLNKVKDTIIMWEEENEDFDHMEIQVYDSEIEEVIFYASKAHRSEEWINLISYQFKEE